MGEIECYCLDGPNRKPILNCMYAISRISRNRDTQSHNPEVAGSNPVPATKWNGPRRLLRGPFSCPLGTLLETFAKRTSFWGRVGNIRWNEGGAGAPPARFGAG